MNKLIVVMLVVLHFYSIDAMNTYEQVQENAAFVQQLMRNLHSPTYMELLMRQRGIPLEKVPQKIQRFYEVFSVFQEKPLKKRKIR